MREMQTPSETGKETGIEKKKFTVAIVDDSSHIESAASDAADKKMTASKEQLSGFKGFLKKIWKHNLFKEYYRQKEKYLAKDVIVKSGNAFVHEGGGRMDMSNFQESVIKKFTSEFEQENIHKEAGDVKERLGETTMERKIQSDIKELISDFAKGSIDEACFVEEKKRILSAVQGVKPEVIDQGQLYVDNMLEIAKQVKQSFEHGEGLEKLDFDLDVVVGRVKSGVRTEAQFNTADRIVEKIKNTKVGRFANEATLAGAVGMAYSLAASLSQRLASSKAAAWMSFGGSALLGGAIAGLRESDMFANDVRQHRREMAQGARFDEKKSPRRKELEALRYGAKSAVALAEEIEGMLYAYDNDGARVLKKDVNEGTARIALEKLAEIEARTNLSGTRKIDLISFSDVKKVERERQILDALRGQARHDLKNMLAGNSGLALPEGKGADVYFSSLVEVKKCELMGGDKGIEAIDRLSSKMKKKHVANAIVKGIGTGLVFGAAAQELAAFITPNKTGLFQGMLIGKAQAYDGVIPPVEHITPLEYSRRWLFDDLPKMSMQNSHEAMLGNSHFRLPQGAEFAANPDGSYRLLRYNEVLADGITLDKNGLISSRSQGVLDYYSRVEIRQSFGSGNPKEFVANMHDHALKISRKLWYDNDTPKPIFDKNELKLWWGGKSGAGIDQNGNYVFSVKHMMPDGSYHKNFSADAQDLMKTGKLKMLLSLSKDTQNKVFEIPIDASGNAVIDPKSEIGKLFFANEGGHAKFLGKYAEVAQMMGNKNQNGAEAVRILATHVGKGVDHVAGVPMGVFDVPEPYIIDQWIIPAPWRNPLEKTTNVYPYLDGYFREDARNLSFYKDRRSKSLENPNVKLDHYKEIDAYFGKQNPDWMSNLQDANRQIGSEMDRRCRLAVCIPVAGHQEEKNIYKTLENYKRQKDKKGNVFNSNLFELILFVNHPKDKKPDGTLDEIDRFRSDNPDMPVKVVYKQLERADANIGTIRKLATDLALLRHHGRGSGMDDLIIVSNDADCSGMSETYLQNYLDEFSKHENADALLGKIDWEKEAYKKSPLIHMGTRFFQYIDVVYRHHKNKIEKGVGSSGANFAFKSSIYAAVGGYIEGDTVAEDKHLGTMIKTARRGSNTYPIEYAGNRSKIETNARRAVSALKKGLAPAEQWGTDFGPDDALREMGWNLDGEKVDLENPDHVEKLRAGLELFINRTIRVYQLEASSWETVKALRFMGIKYGIQESDGQKLVVIKDISHLVGDLKKYQRTV